MSAKDLTVPIRVTKRNREQLREMILRGPDKHPGVNYIVRGDTHRVRITDRTKFIWSGFRCLNPTCDGGDPERGEPYEGMAPELNEVLRAPNFLPGLIIRRENRRTVEGLQENWVADLDSTIANLRGEDENGNQLPEDDPQTIIHNRWRWEQEHTDEPYPDHLAVVCPHCASPWNEEDEERTAVEDRLATIDIEGNPKPGMVVERHLIDGDVVIFNRQPSLHRMSMMVHEVRVMPGKTFRFNLSVCTPYNADFDGDEMNLHIIQSEEARAEAKVLMRVQENILSPRYGGAVIGGIHDHISGAYLLTNNDRVIPKIQALEVLSKIEWTGELPKEVKDENGDVGYAGRELLNLILPDGINLSYKSRSNDQVEVVDGKIMSGTIDKTGIGAEDGKLLDAVLQNHGSARGAQFLNELTQLTIGICTALGFTTGIDDEDLPPAARSEIIEINSNSIRDVDDKLELYGKDGKKYEARPGRTPQETLEEDIMQILDQSRSRTGEIAREHLASDNAAVMMAVSGARGSMDNLSMMAGSIGQTRVRGQRLERGYKNRVLSHFERNAKGAREKGFVQSSFKAGLEPTEFFMLSVSGRESLVDTAVRTSKSGYMQRRLINAMDDLKVHNDGQHSVRNTADRIIQFSYGEDGTDPTRSIRGAALNVRSVLDNALGGGN
jgi:DNA-directed RNA polymerase subunit A'